MKHLWSKILVIVIVIFSLCVTAFYQQSLKPRVATAQSIKKDVELVNCDRDKRFQAVKELFINSGAPDSDVLVESFENVENLVLTKKGKSTETIIVGAHYDFWNKGCGAVDNWTGIVILANLYKTLKDVPTEKSFKFVAFGKEEQGLIGSNAMAQAIPEAERKNYCAMINVDSFGLNYPQVLENVSHQKLTAEARALAKEIEMPIDSAMLSAEADSTSFNRVEIPAITFHGLSDKWRDYLHTSKDQLKNVNSNSVYIGYQFVLRFLVKIDAAGCNSFR